MNSGRTAPSALLLMALFIAGLVAAPTGSTALPQKSKKDREKYISRLPETILAKVGDEDITYGELQQAFRKNMNRKEAHLFEIHKDSVTDFLDLYVKYRLKVQDAVGRKVHEDPEVKADIQRNRDALAAPYYFEKKLVSPNVEQILERRSKELKLAIILIGLPQEENPDTTESYARAKEVTEKLQQGVSFDTLVAHYSDDALSKSKGGEIPFATSGFIHREVENAMYSLRPGQVHPKPIRTNVGYFFIKLLKAEPLNWYKCSHILFSINENRDSAATHHLADSIRTALKRGAGFAEMARKFSDDKSSAQNGGALASGYYSRSLAFKNAQGRLVPEFENNLFALNAGQVSNVVQTVYGFHIIRCDSIIPYSKEEGRDDVKKRYKRIYFERDKQDLLDRERTKRGYAWNVPVMNKFRAALDTTQTALNAEWSAKVDDKLKGDILYKTGKSSGITVGQFIDSLSKRADLRNSRLTRRGLQKAVNTLTEPTIMTELTKNLESDYPDFGSLMREFRDGILIFKVEDEEVWSKLKFDSVRARAYYDTTKARYKTETKYDISEIFVMDKENADNLYKEVQSGANFETLAEQNTMRRGYREKKGAWGPVAASRVALAQHVVSENAKAGDILKPFTYENGYSILRLNAIEKPRMKSFEEALPDFAATFQDVIQKELTEEWLSGLRQQYPVWINKQEIADIWGQWSPKGN